MPFPDTIAAIATPPGQGGLGIVRLSGPKALEIADRLFRSPQDKIPSRVKSHTVHYGYIFDPGSNTDIDEVMLSVFRAPRSYTTEDVVEINAHGGMFPLGRILEAALAAGARLARPGEFTLRAYLNGRIDLVQAEAVIDIISSQSRRAMESALRQLEGGLSGRVQEIKERVVEALALLEAAVDFPEEELELPQQETLARGLSAVKEKLKELLSTVKEGQRVKEGFTVALLGKPNVGKSSLLNALLQRDRAIVTPYPGTTRDTVEGTLELAGYLFKLVDTAGLREARDPLEQAGVERSQRAAQEADLLLLLFDQSQPLTEEDFTLLSSPGKGPALLVANKADLPAAWDWQDFQSSEAYEKLVVSAMEGQGLGELKMVIARKVLHDETRPFPAEDLVANLRHQELLQKAFEGVERAEVALAQNLSPEFAASDLQSAHRLLAELLGEEVGEEVLEAIFARFCVGK
jgi:tRNA modification GTPase